MKCNAILLLEFHEQRTMWHHTPIKLISLKWRTILDLWRIQFNKPLTTTTTTWLLDKTAKKNRKFSNRQTISLNWKYIENIVALHTSVFCHHFNHFTQLSHCHFLWTWQSWYEYCTSSTRYKFFSPSVAYSVFFCVEIAFNISGIAFDLEELNKTLEI